MATQKEMKEMRENVIGQLTEISFEGFTFQGQITDGLLYVDNASQGYLVLKPIAKKENFDGEDALQEFQEREQARIEREKAKADKVSKAKAKKEEED